MSDTISDNTSGGNPTTGQLNTGPRYGELQAEIERLRAALEEIANLSSVSVRAPHIARRALEPKP